MGKRLSKRDEHIEKEGVEKLWLLVFLAIATSLWFFDGWVLYMLTSVKDRSGVSLFAWVVTFFFATCGAVGFSGIACMSFSMRKNAGKKYDIIAQKEAGG